LLVVAAGCDDEFETVANPKSTASRQSASISDREASGRSKVWSMMEATSPTWPPDA
jgi:hypothetical protein